MTTPPAVRTNAAILLLAGAALLVVMVDNDRRYWTPLVLGVTFLASAVVGGRAGGSWAPACVR